VGRNLLPANMPASSAHEGPNSRTWHTLGRTQVRKEVSTPGNTKRKSIPWPSDSPEAPTKSFAPRTAPAALRISRPSTTSVLSPTSTLNLSNSATILPIRGTTPHHSPPSPQGRRSSPSAQLAHQGDVPRSNLPVMVEDLRPPSCARGTFTCIFSPPTFESPTFSPCDPLALFSRPLLVLR